MYDEIRQIIDEISSKTDLDNPENNICSWYYLEADGQRHWIAEYVGKHHRADQEENIKMFRTICNGQVDDEKEEIVLTYDALVELIILYADSPQFTINRGHLKQVP
ncbi:MAG: hypothetical protein OXF85_02265 [Candidatus Saccharibacteria bacterium]|nr:hypothetical protein [Candidatus Saccharibacteria bacterium]